MNISYQEVNRFRSGLNTLVWLIVVHVGITILILWRFVSPPFSVVGSDAMDTSIQRSILAESCGIAAAIWWVAWGWIQRRNVGASDRFVRIGNVRIFGAFVCILLMSGVYFASAIKYGPKTSAYMVAYGVGMLSLSWALLLRLIWLIKKMIEVQFAAEQTTRAKGDTEIVSS